MSPSRLIRSTAVALLIGFTLLVGAGTASAHARLLSSDPADGTSLDAAPETISLTFNEEVGGAEFSTVTVVGPDGTNYQSGPLTVSGSSLSSAVSPLGAAGAYQIGYRVISADGHPITGSVAFTLTTDGPGAATTAPATSAQATTEAAPAPAAQAAPEQESGGMPIWPWIVGGIVLVGGGAFAAMRLGR